MGLGEETRIERDKNIIMMQNAGLHDLRLGFLLNFSNKMIFSSREFFLLLENNVVASIFKVRTEIRDMVELVGCTLPRISPIASNMLSPIAEARLLSQMSRFRPKIDKSYLNITRYRAPSSH